MSFLQGVRVIDFTTLLPGPWATLTLAEAGAEVVKIERPGGDPMRASPPFRDGVSVPFAMLNRGKRSIEIDLKETGSAEQVRTLVASADVLIEQFRPGVMDRLGLGYETIRALNPRIVYCSITGYGHSGPKIDVAGHDLNYVAETGMLSLTADPGGLPLMPHVQIADIGAGSYPAVINILMGLFRARAKGEGAFLDIAMTEQTFPFLWQALSVMWADGKAPGTNEMPLVGGSPRYGIYATSDGGALAVGALEDRFWVNFCDFIELPPESRDDAGDPRGVMEKVRVAVAVHPSSYWRERLEGAKNLCCSLIPTLAEAVEDPQFAARGVFDARIALGAGAPIPAVPAPLAPAVLEGRGKSPLRTPELGEDNALLEEQVAA